MNLVKFGSHDWPQCHCEERSDEAISWKEEDCFASLAMTVFDKNVARQVASVFGKHAFGTRLNWGYSLGPGWWERG